MLYDTITDEQRARREQPTVPQRRPTGPAQPALDDTVRSGPPTSMDDAGESGSETSTEIEIFPPAVDDPFHQEETHILSSATHVLSPIFEDEATDPWQHHVEDKLLVALVEDTGQPVVAAPRPAPKQDPLLLVRRAALIGGSCVAVLVMAILLYSVVVRW